MFKREIILFIVLATVSTIQSYEDAYLTEIVDQCCREAKEFESIEYKYAKPTPVNFELPDFAGPQIKEFNKKVYIKEKLQRPFECITERVPWYQYGKLESNPAYINLVSRCKNASPEIRCDLQSYKYRTIDGTCNNLRNVRWGSCLSRLRRHLPANYIGVAGLRQSVCAKPLPEPRVLSLRIDPERNNASLEITNILPFFGQFVAHDFSDTPSTFVGDKPLICCPENRPQHPQCAPIHLPSDDYFYSKRNISCINVVRAAMLDKCEIGKRDHMNDVTSYIDLSVVYGFSSEMSKNIRASDGSGTLRAQTQNNDDLLPPSDDNFCDIAKKNHCFLAGDRRVNVHSILMSIHTLFFKEHNRLARELREFNPRWDEETLFQEARKINIAEFQVIIYKEFLPVLLGEEVMNRFRLRISKNENTCYNSSIEPNLWVEFNAAAFRLHTLLDGIVSREGIDNGKHRIRDISFNVNPLYHGKMSSLMKSVCQTSSQKYDRFVTEDVTNFLYTTSISDYGFDLAAANIQRGRDVGLPNYPDSVRHFTNGSVDIQHFEDLNHLMDKDNVKKLKDFYCDPKDIDLWLGLINEIVRPGMIVGPTAGEIIAHQFRDSKYGDRFYFEHKGVFTDEQLETLRTVTLSSILCLNTDIDSIQLNAFKFPHYETNPTRYCKDIPQLDVSHWIDWTFFDAC